MPVGRCGKCLACRMGIDRGGLLCEYGSPEAFERAKQKRSRVAKPKAVKKKRPGDPEPKKRPRGPLHVHYKHTLDQKLLAVTSKGAFRERERIRAVVMQWLRELSKQAARDGSSEAADVFTKTEQKLREWVI